MEQMRKYQLRLLLLVIVFVQLKESKVQLVQNGNKVTCLYNNATHEDLVSFTVWTGNTAETGCDILGGDDHNCWQQLVTDKVMWSTTQRPCERVTGNIAVFCSFNISKVSKICCRLKDSEDCFPRTTTAILTTESSTNGSLTVASTDKGERKGDAADDPTTTTGEVLPTWAAAVIVPGGLTVFILLFIVVFCCFFKSRHSPHHKGFSNEQQFDESLSVESTNGPSDKPPSVELTKFSNELQMKESFSDAQVTEDSFKREQPKVNVSRAYPENEHKESEYLGSQLYCHFINTSSIGNAVNVQGQQASKSSNNASIPQCEGVHSPTQIAGIREQCGSIGHSIQETTADPKIHSPVYIEASKVEGVNLGGAFVPVSTPK